MTCLNRVLCVALNTEMSIDESLSSVDNQSPEENRAICHFINTSIPHEFALCIGITPLQLTAKAFFDAIKARCCPGSFFENIQIVHDMLGMLVKNGSGTPRPNNVLILSLRRTFAMFKKLGIKADELEGLLSQAVFHAPATLDQLVMTAILTNKNRFQLSPFVYHVADLPTTPTHLHRPHSLGPSHPWHQNTDIRRPPDHLIDKFGAACFHCGQPGHWRADSPNAKGVENPNPHQPRARKPDKRTPLALGSRYQRERVCQIQFVEHHAADKVLIDSGASIHLSGSAKFATNLHTIHPFHIFFADSNSSITITQMATLKIRVRGGLVIISDIVFSDKILGTILSVGRLCRVGVFPLFSGLMLSLVVCDHLITTTFHNDCWWMNVNVREGTIESAAETSSLPLIEMNLLSFPTTSKLSFHEWNASNRVVRSFLKQHVPSFRQKSWQPFYCEVCVKSKSTHQLARACVDVPKDKPVDLLVSSIMGPFNQDPHGF
ncbi:hypothetical protein O181_066654 [Austropuccinia psidii MF-1]|uniref:CCHC-type domain-containing protein n=1 Tax=Austropuccinia psidii MF-1 TaxID=1389203 RepID=A0A9Q3ETV8_9BASI|nr:hypothetical protein [Austropuccinia psidii MF-1]